MQECKICGDLQDTSGEYRSCDQCGEEGCQHWIGQYVLDWVGQYVLKELPTDPYSGVSIDDEGDVVVVKHLCLDCADRFKSMIIERID